MSGAARYFPFCCAEYHVSPASWDQLDKAHWATPPACQHAPRARVGRCHDLAFPALRLPNVQGALAECWVARSGPWRYQVNTLRSATVARGETPTLSPHPTPTAFSQLRLGFARQVPPRGNVAAVNRPKCSIEIPTKCRIECRSLKTCIQRVDRLRPGRCTLQLLAERPIAFDLWRRRRRSGR